jgi:hypothetical protein
MCARIVWAASFGSIARLGLANPVVWEFSPGKRGGTFCANRGEVWGSSLCLAKTR